MCFLRTIKHICKKIRSGNVRVFSTVLFFFVYRKVVMISNYTKWVEERFPALSGKTIATVSMEGYVPELSGDCREANTKGGLGVYFGDKLEGLDSIGLEMAVGCMPMYSRRIVQVIRGGTQQISYKDVSYADQPVTQIMGLDHKPMTFDVWGIDPKNCMEEKRYHIKVFCIDRGGTPLYMFHCPEVFDVLYPDDATHHGLGRQHRFLQETVFGVCVRTLFRLLDFRPDVVLANEGHVAIAVAAIRGDANFEKTAIVYTNHTVVPAGLEVYDISRLFGNDIARARYVMRLPGNSWQQLWKEFVVEYHGKKYIDFSKGALEICNAANAVSEEHAKVTHKLFPKCDMEIVPVLNGSGNSWVLEDLRQLEIDGQTPTAEKLLEIGSKGKQRAFDLIDERIKEITDERGQSVYDENHKLDIDKPTVWLVRRVVEYKSQYPILKDIVHVVCADRGQEVQTRWGKMSGLGMQVVVGGMSAQHSPEEGWIREFVKWMQEPGLKGRFVFVPGSDTHLIHAQAVGADICMNCPQPAMEACGTSDQRSARNGGINVATRSGGPLEYITDGVSGMLVGPYKNNEEFYDKGPKDILDKLAELSQMYYSRSSDGRWRDMKLKSYLASSKVTAMAMEKRYAKVYVEAIESRTRQLMEKERARRMLPEVQCRVCDTGVIYEMVPRDYKSADGRCGLSVICDELDMIAQAGVDYIYLVGVMKHTSRPFEPTDPFDIDEKTGTFDDLQKFVDKCHSLGIKVLLDWMANQHVAKVSPLCTKHPEWFLYTDGAEGNYYFEQGLRIVTGRERDPEDNTLSLVSATDEVCIKSFPRRWTTLAQPDLSHPELQQYGIEIGRFWLEKGFDGFRVDAALATFPDQIKHNWGLTVKENLSKRFIEQMRQIDPNCFIMFEGFERHEELLELAGHTHCGVYNWRPRNFSTEMLKTGDTTENIIKYLKEAAEKQKEAKTFVNLGPEHDAFDFNDPWSKLTYSQRQLMYLLYQFIPGYSLVFNGQLDGQQHYFKTVVDKSEPVPLMKSGKSVQSRFGRWLFNLRRNFSLIENGRFTVLEGDNKNLVAVARYSSDEILAAIINPNIGAQEARFNLKDIIDMQLADEDYQRAEYLQEVIQPVNRSAGYIRDFRENVDADELLSEKLYVGINSCSWQIIRLCLSVGPGGEVLDESELFGSKSGKKDSSETSIGSSLS